MKSKILNSRERINKKLVWIFVIIIALGIILYFWSNFPVIIGNAECLSDSDCHCNCCTPAFNLTEATENKLNERCFLYSLKRTPDMKECFFDACNLFLTKFNVKCISGQCRWVTK